jgi:hypothetical protein
VSLEQQITDHSKNVQTQTYSMSVGELISMYRDGELNLHPEFQRFFRWTPEQKSRLIESLILGIPIPPIFVSEREDSKWEVIDGLQRLSTILELLGELRDINRVLLPPLELTTTHYLPNLDGRSWSGESEENSIPESIKIRLKRARLDVIIVRNASDSDVKYEVFQRLNTGGSAASDQEVRNCLLVMTNLQYFRWVQSLGAHQKFRDTLSLTDKALDEAFDMELITRLLVFSRKTPGELQKLDELGAFLNRESIRQASEVSFPYQDLKEKFEAVFDFLAEFGENAFRRYDPSRGRYAGPLLVSVFEVVAAGLFFSLQSGGELPDRKKFLAKHKGLWSELSSKSFVGSGVRASTRVPETVKFGRKWVRG